MAHIIHSICLLCQQHQSKRLHTYFLPSEVFLIGIYLFRQWVICSTFFISDELEIITHFNQFYRQIYFRQWVIRTSILNQELKILISSRLWQLVGTKFGILQEKKITLLVGTYIQK